VPNSSSLLSILVHGKGWMSEEEMKLLLDGVWSRQVHSLQKQLSLFAWLVFKPHNGRRYSNIPSMKQPQHGGYSLRFHIIGTATG
jgi:hypothetical protein